MWLVTFTCHGPSEEKAIKILEKRERGRIQGLPKYDRSQSQQKPIKISGKVAVGVARDLRIITGHPYYTVHRMVIFAIARLSC